MTVRASMILMVFVCSTLVKANGDEVRIQTQENFRSLFNSITRNDGQEIRVNQDARRREADRERQAFASMRNALQTPKRRAGMSYDNPPRYRRGGTISNSAASEYIACGESSLSEDETVQTVFQTTSVLLPFLSELLGNHLPHKLATVEVRGGWQNISTALDYHLFSDIRAWDTMGNAYLIEMERAYEPHDLVRAQYTAAKAFTQFVDTTLEELRENATTVAEEAVAKAVATGAKAADVDAARKKAAKAGRKTYRYEDLDRSENIQTTVVIVFVEKLKVFRSKFTTEDECTLYSSLEEYGQDSKVNFLFIDLERFSGTKKLGRPNTPLDHWCWLLWRSKDKRIEKKQLKRFENFPGIPQAVEMLRKLASQ